MCVCGSFVKKDEHMTEPYIWVLVEIIKNTNTICIMCILFIQNNIWRLINSIIPLALFSWILLYFFAKAAIGWCGIGKVGWLFVLNTNKQNSHKIIFLKKMYAVIIYGLERVFWHIKTQRKTL